MTSTVAPAGVGVNADGRSTDPGLSISIVVYHPDVGALRETLSSLAIAVARAQANDVVGTVSLDLIDNGSAPDTLESVLRDTGLLARGRIHTRIVRGHGNVGYGRGHNISMLRAQSRFHLVLNPDVVLADTAVTEALTFLSAHPEVTMITPEVRGGDGSKQYLSRTHHSVFILYLRSFAPRSLRKRFRRLIHAHEVRDRVDSGLPVQVPLASGCFMFGRTAEFKSVGGFSPAYFLYFEDHDLSKRIGAHGPIVYVPEVKITHYGGNTSAKEWKHVSMFIRSAFIFFRMHGWRLV
ncbi:MAG: glycosyltransferase [Gemmatimonadaceae bacterium]